MADQAEVEQALAAAIADALYPRGDVEASAVGHVCRIYRGWPVAPALEEDLVRNAVHVTVQAVKGSRQDTTRFPAEWQGAAATCPLLVDTDGERVRFSGSAEPGVVAGIRVDGRAYAWRAEEATAAGVVAAVLADLVRADRPAGVAGTVVQMPGGVGVLGRAAADWSGGQEVRRQTEVFRMTLWCPSPAARDRVAGFVDAVLAGIVFLDVGGWGCRVQSAGGGETSDESGVVRGWRRELLYRVEYPTVLKSDLPSMLFGAGSVNGVGFVG